jgi:glycosyltransferase involved in cell wall biosynthesis
MAKISVVIPCYNRATLVGETIQNMLDQSLRPDEIIVVDDGSTDNSREVISSFGGIVRMISQRNLGPGAARNAGLKAATGDFIQFMDSDDLASRNKLDVQLKALETTGADFAYGPWGRCIIENRTIRFTEKILQAEPVPSARPMLEWFLSGWSLVFQNCLFRRSILEKAGFYRTDLMPSEDSEYFIRILLAGARPIHTPECLVFYREHNLHKITSTGTSSTHRAKDWSNFLEITGNLVQHNLRNMKLATRIALAASVQQHLEYCASNNLTTLPANHPYRNMISGNLKPVIKLWTLYTRLRRRLSGAPDSHPAFRSHAVAPAHQKLVTDIGYHVVGNH